MQKSVQPETQHALVRGACRGDIVDVSQSRTPMIARWYKGYSYGNERCFMESPGYSGMSRGRGKVVCSCHMATCAPLVQRLRGEGEIWIRQRQLLFWPASKC